MCVNCGCDGVTYPNGSDGVGIVSITDNENGTFTILMSDGSSFISPNYTGPEGEPGIQGDPGTNGINGTTILFSQVARKYAVTDPDTTINIDTTLLNIVGDSLRITFIHGLQGSTVGSLLVTATPTAGSPETIFEDNFDSTNRISKIEIILTKSEVEPSTFKGFALLSTTDGIILYSGITLGNFFDTTNNVITINTNTSAEDSWYDTITVELLKAID